MANEYLSLIGLSDAVGFKSTATGDKAKSFRVYG